MAVFDDDGLTEFLRWAAERGVTDVPRGFASTVGQQNAISTLTSASTSASSHTAPDLGYSLRVAYFPDAGGRGLMAIRNIEEGELILRVPKSALMSVLSAKEDPQLAKAMSLQPRLSSHQILVVHLLNEVAKRKRSPWHTYLVQLPRRHHTLAHFSQSAADALQVEDVVWAAKSAAAKARTEWEGAKDFMVAMDLKRKFRSLNAWLWASATVSSRSLYVPWDCAGTLCPVGDLFNYAPPGDLFLDSELLNGESCTTSGCSEEDDPALDPQDDFSCAGVTLKERLRDGGYDSEFDEYCFYARKPYKAGEQVLLCYGQYTNLELLEHYGFCMPQNPNDVVHIGPPESESADSGMPGNDRDGDTYIGINGAPSFSLLARMRLHHVQPSLRKASRYTALSGEQVSKESDVLAYQWLLKQCGFRLACLPTSIEDDLALAKILSSVPNLKSLMTLYTSMMTGSQGSGLAPSHEGNADSSRFTSDKVMGELGTLVGVLGLVEDGQIQTFSEANDEDSVFEHWRLAVEWRLGYKRILRRCSTLCRRKINELLKS